MARIERSIHVNVPVHAAYNQWTQFTEFPRFMEGIKEVRQIDDAHLHWRAEKDGKEVEWDTEITQQIPDKCIEWRAISGQANGGIVTFEPEPDDKTMIVFKMETDNEDSRAQQKADQDLMRFKNIIESQGRETGAWRGEIKDSKVQSGDDGQSGQKAGEETGKDVGKDIGQTANEMQDAEKSASKESDQPSPNKPEGPNGASQDKRPNGHDDRAQNEIPIQSSGRPEQDGQQSSQQERQPDGGQETPQRRREEDQQQSQQPIDQSRGSMTQSSPQEQQIAQPGMSDDAQAWIPNLMHVWDEPLAMMRRITQGMDQLFDRLVARPSLTGPGGLSQAWIPLVDIVHRDNQLHISADLPGIPKESVRVEIHDNKLTIEGERREESQQNIGQQYRRTERTYGRFYREIPLPEGVDPNSARATMRDGILDITVPLPPPAQRGRRLDIGSSNR